MRKYIVSSYFDKSISKLKGKEADNLHKKVQEILSRYDINHYKNLRNDLKKFKRVHVNNSYVILFFGDNNIVYFVDYEHHDKIYKQSKKYSDLEFF